jgi:hypothetical protein
MKIPKLRIIIEAHSIVVTIWCSVENLGHYLLVKLAYSQVYLIHQIVEDTRLLVILLQSIAHYCFYLVILYFCSIYLHLIF